MTSSSSSSSSAPPGQRLGDRVTVSARSGTHACGFPDTLAVGRSGGGAPAQPRRAGARAGGPASSRRGRRRPRGAGRRRDAGSTQRVEVGDVLRVDRQARCEREAARLGRRSQPLDLRPGRLRVHMVDRHGRDAAPVVDPRVQQPRKVLVAQVRRRLDVQSGPSSTRAAAAVHRSSSSDGSGCAGHPRPRLRAEVLDDHLLHVPVALAELADREQRFDPLRSRLADPDQDPGGERHGASPASRSVSSRRAGSLSGEPKCGPPRADSRSGRTRA